jgi:hypothetical protein
MLDDDDYDDNNFLDVRVILKITALPYPLLPTPADSSGNWRETQN